jgi:hypothetical protein
MSELRMSNMLETVISKPIYRVLADLTQQPRVEVALPLAIKDWVRLKLAEADASQQAFEKRYGMDFSTFQRAWQEDRIPDRHAYEVESDYWEWEVAVTDQQRLLDMLDSLS